MKLLTAQELKERIMNNDNRCTAHPYLLLLRYKRKVSADPEFHYDGIEYVEQESGNYKAFPTMQDALDWLNKDLEEYELKYTRKSVGKWYYQYLDETENVFLTDKGYQEHYEANSHNLKNHDTFGIHAFRNREIKSLYSMIDRVIELESILGMIFNFENWEIHPSGHGGKKFSETDIFKQANKYFKEK